MHQTSMDPYDLCTLASIVQSSKLKNYLDLGWKLYNKNKVQDLAV